MDIYCDNLKLYEFNTELIGGLAYSCIITLIHLSGPIIAASTVPTDLSKHSSVTAHL